MVVNREKLAAILRRGREVIEVGWCKNTYARHGFEGKPISIQTALVECGVGCNFCAIGAAWFAARQIAPDGIALDLVHDAEAVLREHVPAEFGLGMYGGLGKYNDHEGITQADILALYDKAIASVEGGAA